jgi:hypothetical protein
MPIAKRLTPEDRLKQSLDDNWRRVFSVPLIAGLVRERPTYWFDPSPAHIHAVVAEFGAANWITAMDMNDKLFIYLLCTVLRRAYDGASLLDEQRYSALDRHINALTTLEKIDSMQGCAFALRQVFLWDLPNFREQYPKGRKLHLPEPIASKPKRVKLPQHRKK